MTDNDPRTSDSGSGDLAGAALRRGKRLRRRRQVTSWGASGSLVLMLTAALAIGIAHASSGPSVAPTGGGTNTSTSSTTTTTPHTSFTTTTPHTSSTTTTTPIPVGGVIPAGFQPRSFTAVSLDEWWMLGTARCTTGSGDCGAIVRTTNGGSSFTGIPSPPVSASDVTQLRFANALDGYAFDPELWTTTNGGVAWTKVATPGPVVELEAADGEAYALACVPSASCQSVDLLVAPVGSGKWQKASTPVKLGYGAQFTLSGPNLYVLSGNEPPLVLLYSSDKAASFTKLTDPCIPTLGGTVTAAADGSPTLWAACPTGTEAGAWLSTNGGMTWHSASPPMAGFPNGLGLTAASSSIALAWPGQQVSARLPAAMDRTTNEGKTFSAVLSSSWHVSWAGFSDPARAYALATAAGTGATGPTHLVESNDGGATWHEVAIKS